jgi:hypothetical protein
LLLGSYSSELGSLFNDNSQQKLILFLKVCKGAITLQELINVRVHDYYWNEDISCAVTTLNILSEIYYPEIHPQVIEAAFGLNAGRCGYQCGLVEGALLFIGIYGSYNGIDNKQITNLCHGFCDEFQECFGSILCSQLRPQGFSSSNPPHLCESITQKAIAFSAGFIAKNIKDKLTL